MGAPGGNHDARMLKSTQMYHKILNGNVIPNRTIQPDGGGEILPVTVDDSAFPKHPWLLTGYNEETRVVTEYAYGMLKGRCRILYKKTEYRLFNLKYIIMAFIIPHNLCISLNDPCEPRWRLAVQEVGLINKEVSPRGNKHLSVLTSLKIFDCLWSM